MDFHPQRYRDPSAATESLRRGLERQLVGKERSKELWRKEENDNYLVVEEGLKGLRDCGYRLIVTVDEFEGIQRCENFRDWIDTQKNYISNGLLTFIVASKSLASEIDKVASYTTPFSSIFGTTVILGAMEAEEWQQLVKDGFESDIPDTVLDWLKQLTGGLPLLVQMAASLLWQHGDLKIAESEFRFQAARHFSVWWARLTMREQMVFKSLLGLGKDEVTPTTLEIDWLKRYGLISSDEKCFSAAFLQWLKEQELI